MTFFFISMTEIIGFLKYPKWGKPNKELVIIKFLFGNLIKFNEKCIG